MVSRLFLPLFASAGLLAVAQPVLGDAVGPRPAAPRWLVAEPWLDPARGRGYWNHNDEGLLTWDTMLHVSAETPLGRYVVQVRRWGYNAFSLPARMDVDAHPDAVRALCAFVNAQGMGMFIHRDWNEPDLGGGFVPPAESDTRPRAAPLLSPYHAAVRAYWIKRVAKDFELIPHLGGYRMDGGEYSHINGAPWMGAGPEMAGKTGEDTMREALRLVADQLAPHHGTLFWRDCEDDPWGSRDEVWYFRGLTGKIPANAYILMKDYYWDYQPGWPAHPLDLAIKPDASGQAPYLTTIQLPGEYTGTTDFPWCQVDHIAQTMKTVLATGQQGFWVAALPLAKEPWDHPLNLVNWYAAARLLANPNAAPGALIEEWATKTYGAAAAPGIGELLRKVTQAARGMYFFDGVATECHSRFPSLIYLDCHLCGPMRQTRRMTGMMGLTLPLDMYPPEAAARIRADPANRLVFNQAPIDELLKTQGMAQKDDAVRQIRESIELVKSLRGKISARQASELLAGLEGNLTDTLAFREMMALYFDWKLGRVTEARIDAALARCRGLKGAVVPDPLDPHPKRVTNAAPASLKTFAEQMRSELRHPWIEDYWIKHPTGVMGNPPDLPPGI